MSVGAHQPLDDGAAPPEAAPEDGGTGAAVAPAGIGHLPEEVRQRVIALVADGLGAIPAEGVPPALRRIAQFTPAKRARLAAVPIAAALESHPDFRERIGAWVAEVVPGVAEAVTAGRLPTAAAPVDVAAVAYLLGGGSADEVLRAALAAVDAERATALSAEHVAAQRRITEAVRAAKANARADVERVRAEAERIRHENEELRRRLHDARDRARHAEAELAQVKAATDAEVALAQARVAALEADLRRARSRLADAESAVEQLRRGVREGRQADDARLWLLIDTVVSAAQGLRRELALPPPAMLPADQVTGARSGADPFAGIGSRGLEVDDPAVLDQLLSLPQVHLVIDGYNVTKTGYGDLPLETQRGRLLGALGALAARTNAEVTCVFDGAALTGPVPAIAPRGVRVRFSDPGETADELIRRLVRAEPPGRPVVVVSSDREVVDGVRRAGARAVTSAALLRRLDRS